MLGSPRSIERGPVEASFGLYQARQNAPYLRAQLSAAPLKPGPRVQEALTRYKSPRSIERGPVEAQ